MKNLPSAAFAPDVIELATSALHLTVNSLPEPASSAHVNLLAQFILRTVEAGERDLAVLRTSALLELQSASQPD